MYRSPITIIEEEARLQIEGEILKAVQKVGVTVDKEELLKALKYDREQYNEGYEAGKRDSTERIVEQLEKRAYETADWMCGGTMKAVELTEAIEIVKGDAK